MSDSESESESDADEVQIKKYFNTDLLSSIQQAKYAQESHGGIKRAPGHHLLRNKKQVVIEKRFKVYEGRHWDVDCDNSLDRATRRMTIHAINVEVSKEQLRRVKDESQIRRASEPILHRINQEFWNNVTLSERRQKADEMDTLHHLQTKLDDVQTQLVRKHNTEQIDKESELEKERQLDLLTSMKDKTKRTESKEDLLIAMAESNRKKSIAQTDLLEAFSKYEEDEDGVDKDYDSAMFEVMDESLNSLKQMFSRQRSRRLSLDEQDRRVTDLRTLLKNGHYQQNMSYYNQVMGNLRQSFQRVWKQEAELEAESKRLVEERKVLMLEQLVRKHALKWTNIAFAKEKQRQVGESENIISKADPFRDVVKLALAKAQREMILEKFNGKWIDTRKKGVQSSQEQQKEEELSEHDKKLKMIRMKSRRKSCVVKEEEEEIEY